uniref:Protein NRT1/ PTR family 5.6 n=1 Tax=Vitis vinifera TaxID=29760 RepID=A5AH99_VITVI|nr:hypothetical protein VITISV_024373 [Vitis vinifera]
MVQRQEGEVDEKTWVYDSSVDHKGRLPLRASTGVWKASLFIIAIEFSERLSYFGIATSLILYLSKVMHEDLKSAAKSVNYWSGVTTTMPLLGGFLADAYWGRFSTVLISSIVYLLGLILLTMSRVVPSLRPCGAGTCLEPRKVHEVVFFLAIYLISIGTGGHKPALESFGADQFDDDYSEERKKKMSYFNWWNFGLCSGLLIGVTVIVYVQDHVSWGVADIILSVVMAVTIVIFCVGRPFYRYRKPMGSPLTPLLQVLVAAIAKRKLPYPPNPSQLYEVPTAKKTQERFLCHTEKLKFLDKAAILEDNGDSAEKQQSSWRLATVTNVEEMKLILNMIPIWLSCLPFGICVAQASTFFIKQGATMNRKIDNDFLIPAASIYSLAAIGMIASVTIYEKILVPVLRQATGTERGIGDGFSLVGLQEYFYDQVPDSMRSLGIAFYLSVIGAANFLSSLLITIVDHVTEKHGKSWFGVDLNTSRLDKFYWLLAIMNMLNLWVYVIVARRYSYKNVQRRAAVAVADCYNGDGVGSMA